MPLIFLDDCGHDGGSSAKGGRCGGGSEELTTIELHGFSPVCVLRAGAPGPCSSSLTSSLGGSEGPLCDKVHKDVFFAQTRPAAFHRRITLSKPPDAQAKPSTLYYIRYEYADPPSDPFRSPSPLVALLLFLERVGRALPKFQSKRPALPRVFSHQAHRSHGTTDKTQRKRP